jgi:Ubiquinone biosynthesis protein COQ7
MVSDPWIRRDRQHDDIRARPPSIGRLPSVSRTRRACPEQTGSIDGSRVPQNRQKTVQRQIPMPLSPPAPRRLTPLDQFLARLQPPAGGPPAVRPGVGSPECAMDPATRRHVAGLMRINHAGEIAAQALYHGQALVSRNERTRAQLLAAAGEEASHLDWCAQRLRELDDRPSRLAPFWYAGSFAIGAIAGLSGDRASLGFVEETEAQVAEHLDEHLQRLPADDLRSRAMLEEMRADEQRHGQHARAAGGERPPPPLRRLMRAISGVMKFGAYRL